MMRLWTTSYGRRERANAGGVVSVATHALLVAAWVVATMPVASLPSDALTNRLYYIPPPNKPPPARESRETVRYVKLDDQSGRGPGPATIDPRKSFTEPATSAAPGGARLDSVPASPPSAPVPAAEPSKDSIFTEIDVDSAVVRSQQSAGPVYPLDLLAKHVEGMAVVRYVVDTTGFADTESFTVIRTTNPGFARAVRDALPYMRFSPAKIGPKKVRQLVEQPFTFRISPTLTNGAKP
jgi:outer membrane biosynthesis protein TonB